MAAMVQKSWQIHNAAQSAQYYFIPCARASRNTGAAVATWGKEGN